MSVESNPYRKTQNQQEFINSLENLSTGSYFYLNTETQKLEKTHGLHRAWEWIKSCFTKEDKCDKKLISIYLIKEVSLLAEASKNGLDQKVITNVTSIAKTLNLIAEESSAKKISPEYGSPPLTPATSFDLFIKSITPKENKLLNPNEVRAKATSTIQLIQNNSHIKDSLLTTINKTFMKSIPVPSQVVQSDTPSTPPKRISATFPPSTASLSKKSAPKEPEQVVLPQDSAAPEEPEQVALPKTSAASEEPKPTAQPMRRRRPNNNRRANRHLAATDASPVTDPSKVPTTINKKVHVKKTLELLPTVTNAIDVRKRCLQFNSQVAVKTSPEGNKQLHLIFDSNEQRDKAIEKLKKHVGGEFKESYHTETDKTLKLSSLQSSRLLGYKEAADKLTFEKTLNDLEFQLVPLFEGVAVKTATDAFKRLNAIAPFTIIPSPQGNPQAQFTFATVEARDNCAAAIKDYLGNHWQEWQTPVNSSVLTLSSNETFKLFGFDRGSNTVYQEIFNGMMPLLNSQYAPISGEYLSMTLPPVQNMQEAKERLLSLGGLSEVIESNNGTYQLKFTFDSTKYFDEQVAFLKALLTFKGITDPLKDVKNTPGADSLTLTPKESLALFSTTDDIGKKILQDLFNEKNSEEVTSALINKTGSWARYYTDDKVPMKTFLTAIGCELDSTHTKPGANFLKEDNYEITIPPRPDFGNTEEVTLKISKQKIQSIMNSTKVVVSDQLGVEGYKELLKLADASQPNDPNEDPVNIRSVNIPENVPNLSSKYSAEMYTCQVCHSVRLPVLTQSVNINGFAKQELSNTNLDESPEMVLVSTAGANFAYGKGFREVFLNDKKELKSEDFEKFLDGMWSNVFTSAIMQNSTDLSLLPIGLGVFISSLPPQTREAASQCYLRSLRKVMDHPAVTAHFKNGVFFNLGPIDKNTAETIFKDCKTPIHFHNKDALNLAQEISQIPGRCCALLNPSDGDVLCGIYNVGELWQTSVKDHSSHVGEEMLMHVIPGQLSGRDMNPQAFANATVASLNDMAPVASKVQKTTTTVKNEASPATGGAPASKASPPKEAPLTSFENLFKTYAECTQWGNKFRVEKSPKGNWQIRFEFKNQADRDKAAKELASLLATNGEPFKWENWQQPDGKLTLSLSSIQSNKLFKITQQTDVSEKNIFFSQLQNFQPAIERLVSNSNSDTATNAKQKLTSIGLYGGVRDANNNLVLQFYFNTPEERDSHAAFLKGFLAIKGIKNPLADSLKDTHSPSNKTTLTLSPEESLALINSEDKQLAEALMVTIADEPNEKSTCSRFSLQTQRDIVDLYATKTTMRKREDAKTFRNEIDVGGAANIANQIAEEHKDENPQIGIMIAANSGLPGGMLNYRIDEVTEKDLNLRTQEESVWTAIILAICGTDPVAQRLLHALTIGGQWGLPPGPGTMTRQGINYTDRRNGYEIYNDSYIVPGLEIANVDVDDDGNKTLGNNKCAVSAFFADSINANPKGGSATGSMQRTLNPTTDYKFFRECVKTKLRSSIDAMASKGIEYALVAQLSCGVYAPASMKDQINSEFEKILEEILAEPVGKGTVRGEYFKEVIIPRIA